MNKFRVYTTTTAYKDIEAETAEISKKGVLTLRDAANKVIASYSRWDRCAFLGAK